MIKLHWHSAFIRIASFFYKKIVCCFVISLYSEIFLLLNSLHKGFASVFAKNGFRDFSISSADSQASWYANSHAVTYAWCFICPLIPPGPFFERWILCSSFVSSTTALKYLAFVFTTNFPLENVCALLGVHGKLFSFPQGTKIHIVNNCYLTLKKGKKLLNYF